MEEYDQIYVHVYVGLLSQYKLKELPTVGTDASEQVNTKNKFGKHLIRDKDWNILNWQDIYYIYMNSNNTSLFSHIATKTQYRYNYNISGYAYHVVGNYTKVTDCHEATYHPRLLYFTHYIII